MTHKELVEVARKWLNSSKGHSKCSVIMTEPYTAIVTGEIPDAIGWSGGYSTLVECKTNRSDFMADYKKPFRLYPDLGVGMQRYYMAPQGLIKEYELPYGWGLLEVTPRKRIIVTKPSRDFTAFHKGEVTLLLSYIRRMGEK